MNEDEKKYHIPRYLDEPMRIILWTWDELLAFCVPMGLIYWLSNQLLLGIFIGLSAFFGIKKLKGDQGHYFLKSLAYWHFPEIVRLRKTPASYIREYIG